MFKRPKNLQVAIIGLGYVGLPLALAFSRKYETIGFDINENRISDLKLGFDETHEVAENELLQSNITFTSSSKKIEGCNVYIITVPTPVTEDNTPDFSYLIKATEMVAANIRNNDVVIYESTVYPGATEEICAPIIEEKTGLSYACNEATSSSSSFYLGYSPERINPGDKDHRLEDIVKVTSGSTESVCDFVDELYGSIIPAGTFKVSSIKIAEAAKVIENTQRDVNIALINELAVLFDKLELDTEEILQAAGTKWNFLPFRPGLVGGHCIGVDPYYLTYKASQINHNPEIILAGRKINDDMAGYMAGRVIRLMLKSEIDVIGSRILVMGIAFKENCPDTRNSKVIDLIKALNDSKARVDVIDPLVNQEVPVTNKDLIFTESPEFSKYDCIILAVPHFEFIKMGAENIRKYGKKKHVFFDLKYAFDSSETDGRL
jgi:UDP-N-acetyl-D-glucosamine/UDP-N-acetyl-D-galactosamine dehydrogenase